MRTGDSGRDATGRYSRPDLLPDIYAGPYLEFEPGLAFVVDRGDRAIGYVIATSDTRAFVRWYADTWWPSVEGKYPASPEEEPGERELVATGANADRMLVPAVDAYPAHLHIDLLPETQGQGFGRRLVDTLADALRARGVPGLHLTAGASNTGALAFYERLGMKVLERGGGVTFGLRL
ncbi:Acetyltransferase (GNAT) family protein [Paramicrobacterium humi]|uniref:Acetyltransferase (GNAT) family protein n=1 Tax=Paramicrobacterium humi TaxID=640635 RepID=A0A1H4MYL1_9MICO|nr:Acetyltransferase (GNAT) family protein [Microbacterium humi]